MNFGNKKDFKYIWIGMADHFAFYKEAFAGIISIQFPIYCNYWTPTTSISMPQVEVGDQSVAFCLTMTIIKHGRLGTGIAYSGRNGVDRFLQDSPPSAFQNPVPESFPYPCPNRALWRSERPPSSVHRLRPGDVDVVAAIGDSLTAGNGALAETVFEVYFNENRGVSWSIGGQGTWRQFLTVPNLLKVMNPNLVGYSLGDGHLYSRQTQFNVAYSGAMDQDLMEEAKRLIRQMKKDPRVDFRNHWKMLTLMIGTNDICSDQCYDANQGVETHRKNLIRLLDYLYYNMPKTLVNLVVMPYIPYYKELVKPPFAQCFAMQMITCSCLFGRYSAHKKLLNVIEMTRKFQRIQEEIAESGRYDNKEDFTVVFQPTNLNSRFPKLPRSQLRFGGTDPHDYTYVAIDCIHYSQKLHARIANVYWNNLFEEPGNKTADWELPAYSKFLCPSENKPYLLTNKNYFINFSDLKAFN